MTNSKPNQNSINEPRVGRRIQRERRVGVSNDHSLRRVQDPGKIHNYDKMMSSLKLKKFGSFKGEEAMKSIPQLNSSSKLDTTSASLRMLQNHRSQDYNKKRAHGNYYSVTENPLKGRHFESLK